MSRPVRLRDRAAVAAERAALAAATSLSAGFRAGADAGLRWATGGGPGPLTGVRTAPPPTLRAVVAELSAAEAVIYGGTSPRHDFALGVEHALLWVEFATPTPPSERTMPAPGTCEVTPDVGDRGEEPFAALPGSLPLPRRPVDAAPRGRRSRPPVAPGSGHPADRL